MQNPNPPKSIHTRGNMYGFDNQTAHTPFSHPQGQTRNPITSSKPSYASKVNPAAFLNPTAPHRPQKSFVDIVVGSSTPSILVKPSILRRGEPAVHFSATEALSMAKPFKLSLVGKFSFDRLLINVIRKSFFFELERVYSSFFVRQ